MSEPQQNSSSPTLTLSSDTSVGVMRQAKLKVLAKTLLGSHEALRVSMKEVHYSPSNGPSTTVIKLLTDG